MPKKPFKTYTDLDALRLKELVSAFNSKVTQVSKTPTLKSAQPERIKYRDLIKDIRSRSDYNRTYAVYSRYLRRGAEKIYTNESGLRITRWLRNETNYAVQRINALRAKKRKQFEQLPGKLRPGALDELNLNPKKSFIKTVTTKSAANKMFKAQVRQANESYFVTGGEKYKANYLKSLKVNYSGLPGFNMLYNFIKELSAQLLLEAVSQDPTFLIEFNYGFDDGEIRMQYLQEQWDDYLADREYFS